MLGIFNRKKFQLTSLRIQVQSIFSYLFRNLNYCCYSVSRSPRFYLDHYITVTISPSRAEKQCSITKLYPKMSIEYFSYQRNVLQKCKLSLLQFSLCVLTTKFLPFQPDLNSFFSPQQAFLGRCNIFPALAALDEVSCLFLAIYPRGCRSDVMQEDVDLNECLWHCLSIAYFPGMLH